MPAFEPVTKFNATVDDANRFPDMLEQAYRHAVSGCPGPVHLQFQGNEGQVDLGETDLGTAHRYAIYACAALPASGQSDGHPSGFGHPTTGRKTSNSFRGRRPTLRRAARS